MLNYNGYRNLRRTWRVYGSSVLRYGTPRKLMNALRTERAYRARTVDVRSYPYVLFIEPLYYCNLKCPLCPRQNFPGARKRDAGRLSLELVDRIFDEIGDYLFQCHLFGNGEPLLDWRTTREIIRRAHARRIFTLVSTNCTLITPRIADEIAASGLDHLVCAIDGTTQESYSRYRVGGSIKKAMEGLRLLVQARDRQRSRMFLEWQFLVHAFNEQDVEPARRLAAELGVDIRFSPLGGMKDRPELQEEWLPADGALRQVSAPEQGSCWDWPCYWLWRAVFVNSNGQLGRCPGYANIAQLGSLEEHPVMSLYNGPVTRRARQLFSREAVADGPFPLPCDHCSYYRRERGGANLRPEAIAARIEEHPSFIPLPDSLVRLCGAQDRDGVRAAPGRR